MSKPANPYADAWQGFQQQTEHHELTVIRDDGLYRHLRMHRPGTRIGSWDIVTWPGHLATSGDIADGYMFSRTTDMFTFFDRPDHLRSYYSDGAPCIDVRYWAEKLCGRQSQEVKTYDDKTFLRQVREHLEENEEIGLEADAFRERQIALLERIRQMKHRGVGENPLPTVDERLQEYWNKKITLDQLFSMDGLSQAQMDQLGEELDLFDLTNTPIDRHAPADERDEILNNNARWASGSEHDAYIWLADHEEDVGTDTAEWDLREYDFHFLLACYAIDHTVQLYRKHSS